MSSHGCLLRHTWSGEHGIELLNILLKIINMSIQNSKSVKKKTFKDGCKIKTFSNERKLGKSVTSRPAEGSAKSWGETRG